MRPLLIGPRNTTGLPDSKERRYEIYLLPPDVWEQTTHRDPDQVHTLYMPDVFLDTCPKGEMFDVLVQTGTYREVAHTYATELNTYLETIRRRDIEQKRGAGRPRGSYKYQHREDFVHDLGIVLRTAEHLIGELPSKAAMASGLGIDEATLNGALTRFELTETDLRRMMGS